MCILFLFVGRGRGSKLKKCAVCGEELLDDWQSLGVLADSNKGYLAVRLQAREMVAKHGFKPSDCLCNECFWK